MNFAGPLVARVFHQDIERDRRATAATKNFAAFLTRGLTLRSLIAPQIEEISGREFSFDAGADPFVGIGFEEGSVAHKGYYPLFAQPVGGPAEGHLVRVITRLIRIPHPLLQQLVLHIRVIIIGALLPRTIWWVADDHRDRRLPLPQDPLVVLHRNPAQPLQLLPRRRFLQLALRQLEGIRPDQPREFRRPARCLPALLIGLGEVHGGDVIGQQQDFVGVQFVVIFVRQGLIRQQLLILDQARQERPRPREGVDHVHPFIGQLHAKMLLQRPVGRAQQEIHQRRRRIDHAQTRRLLAQRFAEEFFIEALHRLAAVRRLHPFKAGTHLLVKVAQLARFLQHAVAPLQPGDHLAQRPRHRVALREAGFGEAGVEDRPGQHVLR